MDKWQQQMVREQKVLIELGRIVIVFMAFMCLYNLYHLKFAQSLPFGFLFFLNLHTQKNLKIAHKKLLKSLEDIE